MAKYIGRRILSILLVFIFMSFVLFSLFNLIPGDPARNELQTVKDTMDPDEYQERYQQLRDEMGLDDPMPVRYIRWFSRVLRGDFGTSSKYKMPVIKVVITPLKNTIKINLFSIIIGLAITIPLGIKCAVHKNSTFDKVVQVVTIIGHSVPSFIIGLLFIYFFAVKLNWFPVSGMGTPNFKGTQWEMFKDTMHHLALPLMVMTVMSLAGMTRYVRAAMIDVLNMDYIKTARAKGVKEKVVIYSHAWRNALLPVTTQVIGWLLSIFSGSLVIEKMFNLHGLGKFFFDALTSQDYNVALAIEMFYIFLALFGNLIGDISYGIVDPRVKVNR